MYVLSSEFIIKVPMEIRMNGQCQDQWWHFNDEIENTDFVTWGNSTERNNIENRSIEQRIFALINEAYLGRHTQIGGIK